MNIDSVLKLDGGEVVCVENNAIIKITGKGESRLFQPSFPEGTPPLSLDRFKELYRHKHFTKSPEKATAKKDKS